MKHLLSGRKIAVISHINPDCDALGSSLGVYLTLTFASYDAYVVNVGALPKKYDFLPGFKDIQSKLSPDTDVIISVDCGSFDRLGVLKPGHATVINIDHHISNDNFGDINVVQADSPSVSCVAFEYLLSCGLTVTKDAATCFYAALLSDSGFFCFEGVNEKTFSLASRLLAVGVDPYFVAKALTTRESLCKIKLFTKVFDGLIISCGGKMAYVCVRQADLTQTKALMSDAEDFAQSARALDGVELGVCFREVEKRKIRVSLRSKDYYDVSREARKFGGGGHARAAGFEISHDGDFEFAVRNILAQIGDIDETR